METQGPTRDTRIWALEQAVKMGPDLIRVSDPTAHVIQMAAAFEKFIVDHEVPE